MLTASAVLESGRVVFIRCVANVYNIQLLQSGPVTVCPRGQWIPRSQDARVNRLAAPPLVGAKAQARDITWNAGHPARPREQSARL